LATVEDIVLGVWGTSYFGNLQTSITGADNGRMREKQQQLREEVKQLLAQAEAADAAEDAEHGTDRRGDELPAELQRRESRLTRIREAKRALETRAKDEAAAAGHPTESVTPDPKAQYNFTDPESRHEGARRLRAGLQRAGRGG
jgi:hypothetical protein